MPSAHINRTKYGGSRKSTTSQWASRVGDIIALSSPVNVGLSSTYNAATDMVDVTVEMNFTFSMETIEICCPFKDENVLLALKL